MKQVLLYSINPEHVLNFLNGHKTIEVRKRDLPQWAKDIIKSGGVVEGYGYCTKGKPYITMQSKNQYTLRDDNGYTNVINGLVVVKFEVSGSEKMFYVGVEDEYLEQYDIGIYYDYSDKFYEKMCLTKLQIWEYGNGKDLYAHHFTNIQPIEPMELIEFVSDKLIVSVCGSEFKCYSETASYFARKDQRLTKAPQSFMTAWLKGE